ncbi:MAG: tetratricopeptide repeat protein [Saprospiraceae bacterium]
MNKLLAISALYALMGGMLFSAARKALLPLLLLAAISLGAQEAKLAQQYFYDGEFEKAVVLFEKLFLQQENNEYYFDRYMDCLLQLQRYGDVEKTVARMQRKYPEDGKYYIMLGRSFEQQFKQQEATAQYRKAIERLPKDRYAVIRLANLFSSLNKLDLAIETFERGSQLLNDKYIFAYSLGELYRGKGNGAKMIEQYLNSLDANPERIDNVQTIFMRYLNPDDFAELQQQLYARIQINEQATHYPEMLVWLFLQRKDYAGALRQLRALDRRLKENGSRIFQLGQIAATDGDYDPAIEAFDFIVAQKGPESPFYLDAKLSSLRYRRIKLVEGYVYTIDELRVLESEYLSFLREVGYGQSTASFVIELAELEAYYINDTEKAIGLLKELVGYPQLNPRRLAEAKLMLGDLYLIQGEHWESTLLYSQVDKTFKDDQLGNEARFRNARLAYYSGDFTWAQAQFDVLKASTSNLISNDALDLSIFITDNLGLDTSVLPLQEYAGADLLIFQNRFGEAFERLERLQKDFPAHSLEDDIAYLRAQVFMKQRRYEDAAREYTDIISRHADGIRADNALFALAEINEKHLNNKEKAKELYEKLFIEYSGSTFAVEARKRYRILRGDTVQ